MPKIILLLACLYLNIPVHNGEYLRKAVFPFRVEKFILHTDAKKPIEYDWDSGEDYIKDFSEADIVCNEETTEQYVRNQIIFGTMLGVDQSLVKEIVKDLGGTVVGYISIAEMYQIEFDKEKDYDELCKAIEELESYSFITYASLNSVYETVDCSD